MKLAPTRLLAQFRDHPPIELQRATANTAITEGAIHRLTENMNHEWHHWLEWPLADGEAIGRVHRWEQPAPAGLPDNDTDNEE